SGPSGAARDAAGKVVCRFIIGTTAMSEAPSVEGRSLATSSCCAAVAMSATTRWQPKEGSSSRLLNPWVWVGRSSKPGSAFVPVSRFPNQGLGEGLQPVLKAGYRPLGGPIHLTRLGGALSPSLRPAGSNGASLSSRLLRRVAGPLG